MVAIAHQTSHETSEQLSRALGEAVVRMWGYLPNTLQSRLFAEAVTCLLYTSPSPRDS